MNYFVFLFSFISFFTFPQLPYAFPLAQIDGELEEMALYFVELMAQGRYAEAYEPFDDPMRAAISVDELASIWDDQIEKFGDYQSIGATQIEQKGEYTAVIVETHFARADVNIRVVFSSIGEISGLFFTPARFTRAIPAAVILSTAFAALFTLMFPVILAFFFKRRYPVSWKYFLYGAAIFIIFQLITRIPVVSLIEGMAGSRIRSIPWLLIVWLIFLCVTAGLFEETGRYIGYRWIMNRDPKTWNIGVMYGLGHGGVESMALVGLSYLIGFVVLLAYPLVEGTLPPELSGALAQQIAILAGSPAWMPLLGAWERLWTIPVHVALSLVVLQAFRRGKIRWLWLAIALHSLVNLFVIGLITWIPLDSTQNPFLASLPVTVAGLLAVWGIWRLRDRNYSVG